MDSQQSEYYLAIDVGKVNMGYAIYDGSNIGFNVLNIEKNISKESSKTQSAKYCKIEVLDKWFDHILKQYNIKKVIIEQQVIGNVAATIIQSIIETICYMRKIECVEFAAADKFKYLNPQYDTKKREHKKIATQYAKNILQNHDISLTTFNKFPKKDDISDAICMSFMTYQEDQKDVDKIIRFLK